jgi:purine-nucleoside phosphorylase
MSLHINADSGQIAEDILLPGDPLRAKWIAENYLEDPVQYNSIRNIFGYTGTYQGKRISVQGTGMGIPSISIYLNELFTEYGVKNAIRIGTCGSIQTNLKLGDVILAITSSTDSNINRRALNGLDFAPAADFSLLKIAAELSNGKAIVGGIGSMDMFYDQTDALERLTEYGVLALEMETTALYSLAAKFRRNALSILTVSDVISTHESMPPADREKSLRSMVELALNTLISNSRK